MADFKIVRVSSKEPRSWSFTNTSTQATVRMETYNVMVEGEDETVEVNRKQGDKPHVGEVLTGKLETTEYGKRFKKEATPFKASYQGKDEAAIKAMWSIGQAVVWLTTGTNSVTADISDIEPLAKDLFGMVDRVKTGEPSGFAKASAVAEKIKAKDAVKEVFDGDDLKDEPVNLDDIPF